MEHSITPIVYSYSGQTLKGGQTLALLDSQVHYNPITPHPAPQENVEKKLNLEHILCAIYTHEIHNNVYMCKRTYM